MIEMLLLLAMLNGADSAKISSRPLCPTTFQTESPAQASPDAWFGADKFKHFAMSYAITAFAFAGARSIFDSDASAGVALAAGATAGLLKEFYDRSRGRPFSARDIVWDAAGIAVGFVMVRQTTWK